MAITKERKDELVNQYIQWMDKSEAMILAEYIGMSMKDIDALRAKVRETGGEFHIVKNTLGRKAFTDAGLKFDDNYFEGSTALVFVFDDPPAAAKAVVDFRRTVNALQVKGGFLGDRDIGAQGVITLADTPPLPVVRAQLLGTLMAPASKLARTLAEPGRQIAAVLKAFSEPESTEVPA